MKALIEDTLAFLALVTMSLLAYVMIAAQNPQ
jgi:hypothetical protein